MIKRFGGDFDKIAAACLAAQANYQSVCFSSMGRDAGGAYRNQPTQAIAACYKVQDSALRINCLDGAVQDSFWDPSGQSDAVSFCRLLTDQPEKDSCYNTIFDRAIDIIETSQRRSFCSQAEADYQFICRQRLKL